MGYDVDSQFRLHKISYDPEGYKLWLEEEYINVYIKDYYKHLRATIGEDAGNRLSLNEFNKGMEEWAASWDCNEGEASQQ